MTLRSGNADHLHYLNTAASARGLHRGIARAFPGRCFLGAAPRYDGRDQARLDHLALLAQGINLPMVAVGDGQMHRSARHLALRLSLRAHPMELLRPRLPESLSHDQLVAAKCRVTVTGLVITRQRPGTASGVVFLTLEDETGIANIVVWEKVYEAFRKAMIAGRLVRVSGRIDRDGLVTHLIAEQVEDVSHLLATLRRPEMNDANCCRTNEVRQPLGASARHSREQAKKLFPSRDFI